MRKIGISILVLFLALGMNIASPFQKNVIQAAENTGFEIHTISVGNAASEAGEYPCAGECPGWCCFYSLQPLFQLLCKRRGGNRYSARIVGMSKA